jgi:hypothetical protein
MQKSPTNYHLFSGWPYELPMFVVRLPKLPITCFLTHFVSVSRQHGWKTLHVLCTRLNNTQTPENAILFKSKITRLPFEKITWRPQYYETAIRVGAVQLDSKMHGSTPTLRLIESSMSRTLTTPYLPPTLSFSHFLTSRTASRSSRKCQ